LDIHAMATSDSSSLLEAGTLVWVTNEGSHFAEEEAGVVVGVGCQYETSGELRSDGIMVKLRISNTRGIFPPSTVSSFNASSLAPRRQRSARVTPSPTPQKIQEDVKPQGKRSRKDDGQGDKKEEASGNAINESKYFQKEASIPENNDDAKEELFRVQKSASSTAKCKDCKATIAKNILRVQPLTQKRGWYHASCAKGSFDSIQPAKQMEGYNDLTSAEQTLLLRTLDQMETDASEENESDDDPPLETLQCKPAAKKIATAAKKRTHANSSNDDGSSDDDDGNLIRASDSDSDDIKDMPYRIEYSPSGRATCKGCDERIQKDEIRIAQRPLFRGKPGFVIYRHLHCTIFTEEILRLQDVGGWRRLKKSARENVLNRIEKSKALVEQENQELEPDELVQASFQGEIRKSPPGLSANLLPFQVEGTSWMYHQEVHVPELRGGILADEMGMVRHKF
jgi:SNF2 family DNA or RNA helicase